MYHSIHQVPAIVPKVDPPPIIWDWRWETLLTRLSAPVCETPAPRDVFPPCCLPTLDGLLASITNSLSLQTRRLRINHRQTTPLPGRGRSTAEGSGSVSRRLQRQCIYESPVVITWTHGCPIHHGAYTQFEWYLNTRQWMVHLHKWQKATFLHTTYSNVTTVEYGQTPIPGKGRWIRLHMLTCRSWEGWTLQSLVWWNSLMFGRAATASGLD